MSLLDKLKGLFAGSSQNGDSTPEASATESGEMISCHEALRLVHEYLDGELVDVSEASVKAHFDVCERCYPHLHLENVFRDTVRRAAGGQTAPPELRDRILALLAEADAEG